VLLWANGAAVDRSKLLKRAAAARKNGKHKKAITLYRQLLEREPENLDLHIKLAPLLVKARQKSEALSSYKKAATQLVRKGFSEQAIGLLRGAAGELPHEAILWQGLANLEEERGRVVDAVEVLLEGRAHMRSRAKRPQAIQLLTRARAIERTNFTVNYDLACLYAASGQRVSALHLLEELAHLPDRRQLARVRARQFRVTPGMGTAWRWIRALVLRR